MGNLLSQNYIYPFYVKSKTVHNLHAYSIDFTSLALWKHHVNLLLQSFRSCLNNQLATSLSTTYNRLVVTSCRKPCERILISACCNKLLIARCQQTCYNLHVFGCALRIERFAIVNLNYNIVFAMQTYKTSIDFIFSRCSEYSRTVPSILAFIELY